MADPVLEGVGNGLKLSESYSGYLEAHNPYSSDMKRIRVGHPGDEVELIDRWIDQDTTWLLVRIAGAAGWLLDCETST